LKATNTDIAMGKYPIGQTPFFKSLVKIVTMTQQSWHYCYH